MPSNPLSVSRLRSKQRAEDPRAIAVSGLILSLSVLKETADAIPPPAGFIIKGTLGGLLQVVDIVKVIYATLICEKFSNVIILQTTNQNVNDINQLIERVNTLEQSIFRPLKGKESISKSTTELVTKFAE
jgi:hypothetical protein